MANSFRPHISALGRIARTRVAKNGMWLYLLEMFNTAVPVLILPYLTRVLGPAGYGEFATALNFSGYGQVVILYGFELFGARVAATSTNWEHLSRAFSSIILARLALSATTILALSIFGLLLGVPSSLYLMLLILLAGSAGFGLQSRWLFQGLQKLKFIAVSAIFARILSIAAIFLFINEPTDVVLYTGIYAGTQFLTGALGLLTAIRILNVRIVRVSLTKIATVLRDAFSLFLTAAMTRVFSTVGVTVLAIVGSSSEVGSYAAIQKIPVVMTMLFLPVSQAIFPHLSTKFEVGFRHGFSAAMQIAKVVLPLFVVMAAFIAVIAESAVEAFFGSQYVPFVEVIYPLLAWLLFSIVNNFLGVQVLVASGHPAQYTRAFSVGLIAVVTFSFLLGNWYGAIGIAFAAVLSEFSLTCALIIQVRRLLSDRRAF